MFAGGTFAQSPFAALGNKTEPAFLSEAAVALAESNALKGFGGLISESASASETFSASKGTAVAITEAATASNSQTVQVQFLGNISELVSAADNLVVLKTLNVRPDGIQLIVSINNVLVWAVIDDSQNANWQNINDAQNPGWTNLPS